MSINRRVDYEEVVGIYNGMLHCFLSQGWRTWTQSSSQGSSLTLLPELDRCTQPRAQKGQSRLHLHIMTGSRPACMWRVGSVWSLSTFCHTRPPERQPLLPQRRRSREGKEARSAKAPPWPPLREINLHIFLSLNQTADPRFFCKTHIRDDTWMERRTLSQEASWWCLGRDGARGSRKKNVRILGI